MFDVPGKRSKSWKDLILKAQESASLDDLQAVVVEVLQELEAQRNAALVPPDDRKSPQKWDGGKASGVGW